MGITNNTHPFQVPHGVVPYRCEVDTAHPDIAHIYVYDSNYPGNDTVHISINTTANTWSYDAEPDWGGEKYLFLMNPVSDYTTTPNLPPIPPRDGIEQKNRVSEYIMVYLSPTDTARFESPAGSIGHAGDSLFATLSDGCPIIPLGYYLLNDTWSLQFSGIKDSTFRLSLFTDSTVIVYWRSNVDSTQGEDLRYPGNDSTLWVGNPDSSTRSYTLEVICVAPDSEIVCEIRNISIDRDDSARYSITPLSGIQVDNYGGEKTYDVLEVFDHPPKSLIND